MKTKKLLGLILIVATVFTVTACSGENSPVKNINTLSDEENLPTNNPGVYGNTPIMKTENGYYFIKTPSGALMFHDEQSEQNIYLCNKPECPHDGNDFCVSTKGRMDRKTGILHGDYIYLINTEQKEEATSYKLLRADLYGSELSEICTFYSAVEGDVNISLGRVIIHKGKMFVSINLNTMGYSTIDEYGIGIGMKLFMIDLASGSYKEIQIDDSGENEGEKKYSDFMSADGDNLYYITLSDNNVFKPSLQCFNITTGETKKLQCFKRGVTSFIVNDDKVYYISTCYKKGDSSEFFSKYKYSLYSVDLKTGEEKILIDGVESERELSPMMSWGNYVEVTTDRKYLYVCTASSLCFVTDMYPVEFYIYDFDGNRLATINGNGQFDFVEKYKGYILNVLDGVVYLRVYEEWQEFVTYSCPVEDIINGKENWTKLHDYTMPAPPEDEESETENET